MSLLYTSYDETGLVRHTHNRCLIIIPICYLLCSGGTGCACLVFLTTTQGKEHANQTQKSAINNIVVSGPWSHPGGCRVSPLERKRRTPIFELAGLILSRPRKPVRCLGTLQVVFLNLGVISARVAKEKVSQARRRGLRWSKTQQTKPYMFRRRIISKSSSRLQPSGPTCRGGSGASLAPPARAESEGR